MIPTAEAQEPVFGQAYVCWNQFAWLYLVSLFTALRGALLWQAAIPSEVTIKQGLIARLLGIGIIVFKSTRGDEVMQFRGVRDPESTLQHIQTVRRRRIFPAS
jgi:hypothetical protein